ncbi:hypothetical protein BGZ63DRAFT_374973 [Mariannaea sp. PMI_226]|nr:hypothetical protein BGZ63DRAFT_374973 [Mariannaea sp. PMI_226]
MMHVNATSPCWEQRADMMVRFYTEITLAPLCTIHCTHEVYITLLQELFPANV